METKCKLCSSTKKPIIKKGVPICRECRIVLKKNSITEEIFIDDVIYDPIRNKLMVIHGFSKDYLGQNAVLFSDTKDLRSTDDTVELTSAWIVFKYFEKVGRI